MLTLPPLSLYIHVPWCVRKCPYCDFNSHALKQPNALPAQDYVTALLADFQNELINVQGRVLQTIFIGGGTPSLLPPQSYQTLLTELNKRVPFADDIEITLEANPGTYEHGRFQSYFDAGINRLSLGVQSFQNEKLKALGRIHSAEEAIHAIESLKTTGFSNINIDLMHGLPNQSKEDAQYDLNTAIALNPAHISWYQLTIEPNTIFYTTPPILPVSETIWHIQEAGQNLLESNGYHQYEISAYSQTGRQAKHNINYWQFGDYLGIGAGAHGKWRCGSTGSFYRNWKTRMPKDYLSREKPFQAGIKTLTPAELPLEFMMNALRLYDGVPVTHYSEATGLPVSTIQSAWDLACNQGLMKPGTHLVPSERGRLFLNDLLELFA